MQKSRVCTDVDDMKVLNPEETVSPALANRCPHLYDSLAQALDYEPILVEDYPPCDARCRYEYNQGLVVPFKCLLYIYSGSKNHLHFIWKIPPDLSETELLQKKYGYPTRVEKKPSKVSHPSNEERIYQYFLYCIAHKTSFFVRSIQASHW